MPALAGRLRALRVVHPFPSLLNAALVIALALVAGGSGARAALLGAAMLGLQVCIGATNDLIDRDLDAPTKPWKPIPAGRVSVGTTRAVALAAGVFGIAGAALVGPIIAILAALMLACGLAYDVALKPTRWAWACFSVAFALLPVYAWYGAVGVLPPRVGLLVALAAAAGPALQLANGLVDLESDREAGLMTLASRLGRDRSLIVIAVLVGTVHGLAWLSLALGGRPVSALIVAAAALAVAGLALSSRRAPVAREGGWALQAGAIALLGVGWLAAVS